MNQHVPIKRHPSLVSFSKEHHFGLLLIWKIRQGLRTGVNAKRIGSYVLFFFNEDLKTHFKEEEEILFTQLPINDELRRQAEIEHQEIYHLVKVLTEAGYDESLLRQFADTLEKHIRFEERVLFNHLQNQISPQVLEEISSRLSNSVDLDIRWKDNFWIEKNECAVKS